MNTTTPPTITATRTWQPIKDLTPPIKTRLIQLLAWASCICREAQANQHAQTIMAFLLQAVEYKQAFFDRVVRQARYDNPVVIDALKKCRGAAKEDGAWREAVVELVRRGVAIVEPFGACKVRRTEELEKVMEDLSATCEAPSLIQKFEIRLQI